MTILKTTKTGQDMTKKQPSYTADGKVNLCSHYGNHYEDSWKKLKIELAYDPDIALLGMDPTESKSVYLRDTCTTIFTIALFTSKSWSQPRSPPVT